MGGLRRTNWDYPWGGDAVLCRGQLVPLRELLRGVLGKVRAERGGKRGNRAQVPEVGKSQLSALMLQGGKMGLWVGIQSDIVPWFLGSYLSALDICLEEFSDWR